ncbi:unhealthy ribosome biogenesis protein 2 homolog [Engraulis encrasicolus]|uniref:unhealthy ribosome biogenesis protein 2 homolog n=1 Tax=Engraulis encrasicolus TaxID=184585 RepID=UPI002FD123A0
MAAIYSGIHLKLKSPQTPWTDKLKLARFAWISPQCVLPNKEQVLFDWTSHALTLFHSKKIDLSQEVAEGLWVYFDDVIHSKKLQSVLSLGKTISLRITTAQVINDRILDHCSGGQHSSPSLATVLSVLSGILSSPVLSVTYTAKYELLAELLARLSRLACSRLSQQQQQQQPGAEALSTRELETLLLTLTTYLSVQRQQTNTNRVFTQVTSHLLQPLLVLRHLLSSGVASAPEEREDGQLRHRQQQHVAKEIRGKVDAALQAALFSPDNLQSYKDELLTSPLPGEDAAAPGGGRKGRGGKVFASPVGTIVEKLCVPGSCGCEPAVLYVVVSASLPLLFRFALDAFCKGGQNKLLCFHLMTKFARALDFTEDVTPGDSFKAENWSLALLALENLLGGCANADVYNVAADRIQHGDVQLKFYRQLAQLLFAHAQTASPAWHRCLRTLLALNHMILEPDLDQLIASVWVDYGHTEPRVQKARDALVSSTLTTYAKLRQLPRLFEELLGVVVCRPAAATDEKPRQPLLSKHVGDTLAICVQEAPFSQSLALCELILRRIQSDLLPDAQEQNAEATRKLLSLSVLLHSVLFSLKTLDHATPVPNVRQMQTFMLEMFTVLKPVLVWVNSLPPSCSSSSSAWCQDVRESSLLLTYTWVEVDSLFQMHCSKYSLSGDEPEPEGEVEDKGSQLLSEALAKDCDPAALVNFNSTGQVLLKLLALQKMKKILLINASSSSDVGSMEVLRKAAKFVVGRGHTSSTSLLGQTWDLQISSIDVDSFPVAHWYVVATNLPMIAPFLTEEDVTHLSELLLTSVLGNDDEQKESKSGLTVTAISNQLLHSALLVELPCLYSAVLQSIIRRLSQILNAQGAGSICPSLLKPGDESSGKVCDMETGTDEAACDGDVDASTVKKMESAVQEILTTVVSGSLVDLPAEQVTDILRLLKVGGSLNADAMSLKDYSDLFLTTFMMATCTQPCRDVEAPVRTAFLTDTYGLLTSLLTGSNAQYALKIARGSKLLEGFMTSVFSWAEKGLFANLSRADWHLVLQAACRFLQRLLELIVERKSSMRLNLEQFTTFLLVKSEEVTSAATVTVTVTATSSACSASSPPALQLQLLLASLSTAADVMTSSLGRNTQLDETLVQLLEKILSVTGPAVKMSLTSRQVEDEGAQAFSVNVVTGMLQSELAWISQQAAKQQQEVEEEEGQKMAEGIHTPQLRHGELYQSCGQQILRELFSAPCSMELLRSALHFLLVYHTAMVQVKDLGLGELFVDVSHNVHKLLSADWLSQAELQELLNPVSHLIGQLVSESTPEQFHTLLLLLRECLDGAYITQGRHRELSSGVTIARLVSTCELPESCSKMFWLTAPQIISTLVSIVRDCGKDASLITCVAIPVLQALSVLLRQGEGLLSNPHHVILGLEATQFIPLDHLPIQSYHAAFEAIHEVLFAIIQCHSQVMLRSAPAFLNSFYRLVASIMVEGKQRADVDKVFLERDGRELLKCAQLVERMYSHIAATAEGFTILSSFMVAQYVTQLQKGTLMPEIKSHLTEGIYSILDMCTESDIKFLKTTLPPGLREVFSELYGSFQHYHKAQRQGEDKYTV